MAPMAPRANRQQPGPTSHSVPPITPTSPEPPSGGKEPPGAQNRHHLLHPAPGLGWIPLGLTQAIGGLSSYDHITFAGRTLQVEQQWGISFIAASVAVVFIDAQLASRSRLRAAQDAARMADETNRERNRAAQARKRQGESLERLHQAALLSARVQLDPTDTNRTRLHTFLSLIGGPTPTEEADTLLDSPANGSS